ncbi:MAG: response regulator [Thermodesulfobacteriota bacterium]
MDPKQTPPSSFFGSETILLVEDEEVVRQVTRKILEYYGYSVLAASNAGEALAIAQQHPGPIHLLLTDILMPGMSGRELAEHWLYRYPNSKVLFMSGYTGNNIVQLGVSKDKFAFIQKPFKHDTLAHKVREVLG